MRRQRDMIGSFRLWRGLLGVSAAAILAGCGWFGSSSPTDSQKARPGADRQVAPTGALPSANPGRQYEPGVAATDETRSPQIGSIIPAKGGQKAQKEAADKEAAERDAKAREEREARDAAEREAKAKEPPPPPRTSPAGALPGRPAAAEIGGKSTAPAGRPIQGEPSTTEPAETAPAATGTAPAPVTAAPMPPPSAEPAPLPPPAGTPRTDAPPAEPPRPPPG